MKTKQLLILLGIFGVLALVTFVLENPFRQSEYEKRQENTVLLFPNLTKEQVTKIEIIADGETTRLAKTENGWVVASMDDYPADNADVETLLTKMTEFRMTQRVSDNPEKQAGFAVDSSGVEAKLIDASDNVLAHLFIGKITAGYLSGYVRVAGSNDVYVAQGAIQSTFHKGERTWRDRRIFDFDKTHVTQLTLVSPKETIDVYKDAEGAWQMREPVAGAARDAEVDRYLATFSALNTDEFVDTQIEDLAEYGLETPESTIAAVLNDDTTRTLHIGKSVEIYTYVKRADNERVFQLITANVERLLEDSEVFIPATMPTAPVQIEAE